MKSKIVVVMLLPLALSACGDTWGQRAVTGGAIGTGAGLAVGALVGWPLLGPSLIGGVVGAGIGALTLLLVVGAILLVSGTRMRVLASFCCARSPSSSGNSARLRASSSSTSSSALTACGPRRASAARAPSGSSLMRLRSSTCPAAAGSPRYFVDSLI